MVFAVRMIIFFSLWLAGNGHAVPAVQWTPGQWIGCSTFQSQNGGIYELASGQSVGCFVNGFSDSIRVSSQPNVYKTMAGLKLHFTGAKANQVQANQVQWRPGRWIGCH